MPKVRPLIKETPMQRIDRVLYANIRRAMVLHSIHDRDAAEAIGVCLRTWERKRAEPSCWSVAQLDRLARRLGYASGPAMIAEAEEQERIQQRA